MATDKKIPMYVLTQEQINQIAAVAGKEAVQTFRAEQVKAEKKRHIWRTSVLLWEGRSR